MKVNKININTLTSYDRSNSAFFGWNSIFFVKNLMFVLLILASLISCEDPYWPDIGDKYQNLLVVEGMITNQEGPYTIQLSTTTSVEDPKYQSLIGYEVVINDNHGNTEILTEVEPGEYKTAVDGIQGVVGRLYQLTIQSPNGKTYRSNFEELKPPVEIDTVYVDVEYREVSGFPFDIPGYQFFLNTEMASQDSSYYLWKLERTYEYHADFLIFFWYAGELHEFPDPDSLEKCWKTDQIYQIYTESTVGLWEPVLSNFPLHYVSFDNREMSVRYSLLVHQFTITEKAQDYWKNVNEQNTSGGELYTKMPFQVRGNLFNVDDPNEPVLGYFHAAGVDAKRIFIDRPGYPYEMYYPTCELMQPDYMEYGFMFYGYNPGDWPRYVTMDGAGHRAVPTPACVDCRAKDGTIDKPEFWID